MATVKRKVGRPKKRGPKKKRKSRAKVRPKVYKKIQWDWKIVSVANGRQNAYFGKFLTIQEAYAEFNRLKEQNKSIIFPKLTKISHTLKECKDEYLLLEKNRFGTKPNTLMRNEYGMFVEQISTNKGWIILDKCPRMEEETFWVYGYDPKTQRKTFQWIYENKLSLPENKEDIKRIILYKNKLIIKCDDGNIDLILCKTMSDCIRLYNALEQKIKKDRKQKQIVFCGSYNRISDRRKDLEEELINLTGWTKKKIGLKTTRP